MKRNNNQQEILLLATSGFSTRELCDKANYESSSRGLSSIDQLAEACWSGLLHEMIPEIITSSESGNNLYIWQIHQSATSLQIQLSDVPMVVEPAFSIDPQIFLSGISSN